MLGTRVGGGSAPGGGTRDRGGAVFGQQQAIRARRILARVDGRLVLLVRAQAW